MRPLLLLAVLALFLGCEKKPARDVLKPSPSPAATPKYPIATPTPTAIAPVPGGG